jgi:hypothetical protein
MTLLSRDGLSTTKEAGLMSRSVDTPTRSSFPISPNTKYILGLLQHHDLMGLKFVRERREQGTEHVIAMRLWHAQALPVHVSAAV